MRSALGFGGRLAVRLATVVVVVVILALLALMVLGAITTQRGWPQTTGSITIQGLAQPVTVIRDHAGIIQITAETQHDLFMAQGYVHAQERMWQMEISRRIGAGRLSELFGSASVDRDKYIRTLGWRAAAERDLAAMAPETIDVLEAYADGVNAWIAEHHGRLSTPFVIAGLLSGTGGIGGFGLEPWTPLDTATWQKVQAWSLGGNIDAEIFRLLADARLGDPARTDELFPPYDASRPVITPSGVLGGGGSAFDPNISRQVETAAVRLTDEHAAALGDLGRLGSSISAFAGLRQGAGLVGDQGIGSNNWVVSGEHTRSGKPILANDPHLGFGMPSIWIINGLHCREVSEACPWNVVGVTFPGAPAVVLGHNARIAWGATNVNPDTQDLFRIEEDPADPAGHYLLDGERREFIVRHETVKVSGGAAIGMSIRSTVHGVVLSDVDERLADGPVLAMRWTSTAEVDLALESFFRINVADDFDEFRAAFDGYGSPSQNFIYADVDGHIGYVLPGLVPIRAGPDGSRVRDGATSSEDWTGYVPRDELPWQLDPASGMIVSANNRPVDDAYPYWLGSEWDPGYRAARITELLNGAGKLNLDKMRDIQMDSFVGRAGRVIPRLLASSPVPQTEDGRVLLSRIVEWDSTCGIDSYGCAAYMTVELAVQRAIFDDELGPIARDYVGTPIAWEALTGVLGQSISPWWDVAVPGAGEQDVEPGRRITEAIDATAAGLRAAFGDPDNWTWGNLHQVTFREQTLGTSGLLPLELYFNSQARPVGGAEGTINNNYSQLWRAYPDPDDPGSEGVGLDGLFDVAGGPSYRLLVDMSDLNGARIVITTGQSGNQFDAHAIDQIPLWANGDSVLLPFSTVNIQATATQTLTLNP